MPGSFIDILPPEAQQVLGGIAILVIAAGFVVWAAGLKIARFSVAMLLGLAGMALGMWLLPRGLGVTVITGGLVGFVAGALAGAIGFRLLQGVILAVCLGLAVGGIYYRWHISPAAPAAVAADVRITDLLIPTDRLSPGTASTPHHGAKAQDAAKSQNIQSGAAAFVQSVRDHWNSISAAHQKRLLIASAGAAAVALLIAFGFPRPTTWVVTALIGALMMLSGVHALLHVYAPQYESYTPGTTRSRYLTLGILMLVGMCLQYRFLRRKRPAKAAAPVVPVAATPAT